MKYIVVKNEFGSDCGVIFPDTLAHKDVAHKMAAFTHLSMRPIQSAGFCGIYQGRFQVWGKSETLGIESREQDSDILNHNFKELLATETDNGG